MLKFLVLGGVALVVSLSGCGGGGGGVGGGGGNGEPPASDPPPVNQAPTVDAGADQSVDEGTTVNLSATGTDSDGTIVSYSWEHWNGPGVTMANADTANMSFVAPEVDIPDGCTLVVEFQVTVTDDDGATGSDRVLVSLNDTNPPAPTPASARFIPLGIGNYAADVSADGSVVVGGGCGTWGEGPFRWTAATGPVALGGLTGRTSVEAVSADGDTVVGWFQAVPLGRIEAFHWNITTGAVGLGDLIGDQFQSQSFGVSADGSVVVGEALADGAEPGQGSRHSEAFRWTAATGMVGLGDLQGGNYQSYALGVSADGSVVVGWSHDISSTPKAMRWTSASGMVGLGDLPDGGSDSRALGVSADGSVIVGFGSNASGREAMLWTSAGGMTGLGYLPGHLAPDASSAASGVSADGNVVVGSSDPDNSSQFREAFVWTQADGMQNLRNLLIADGVTGLDNWVLHDARSISADGKWVVGNGVNPNGFNEGFLTNISAP